MSTLIITPTFLQLLARVVERSQAGFSRELAQYLASLRFPEADQHRLQELAEKQRRGTLTAAEEAEMDIYIRVADLIELLKAKAMASPAITTRQTKKSQPDKTDS